MALHFAADYGQRDVIEYLISKGADVNVSILSHFPGMWCLKYQSDLINNLNVM